MGRKFGISGKGVVAWSAVTLLGGAVVLAGCSKPATTPAPVQSPTGGAAPAPVSTAPKFEKDRFAFVTNEFSNTVSVVDLKEGKKVDDLVIGKLAHMQGMTPDYKYLYVCNRGGEDVTVVDVQNFKVVKTLKVGKKPNHATSNPQGTWVAVNHNNALEVAFIDPKVNEVKKLVKLGDDANAKYSGAFMEHPIWDAEGKSVWVQDKVYKKIHKITPDDNFKVESISIPNPPHTFYFSKDGKTIWSINEGEPFTVSIIDAKTVKPIKTIEVPVQKGETHEGHHGIMTPDGKYFLAGNRGRPDKKTGYRGGRSVGVFDVEKQELITTFDLGFGASHFDWVPNKNLVYGVPSDDNYVVLVDPKTWKVIKKITVGEGKRLEHVVITPDGKYAWQVNYLDGALYQIDLDKGEVVKKVATGTKPHDVNINWWDAYK